MCSKRIDNINNLIKQLKSSAKKIKLWMNQEVCFMIKILLNY